MVCGEKVAWEYAYVRMEQSAITSLEGARVFRAGWEPTATYVSSKQQEWMPLMHMQDSIICTSWY